MAGLWRGLPIHSICSRDEKQLGSKYASAAAGMVASDGVFHGFSFLSDAIEIL